MNVTEIGTEYEEGGTIVTDEAREARRAYWREYYKTHKAEHKAMMERYWIRRAAKARAEQGGAPDGAETIEPDRGTDDNK